MDFSEAFPPRRVRSSSFRRCSRAPRISIAWRRRSRFGSWPTGTTIFFFGLLTDYQDSRTQTTPLDSELLRYVQARIEALNEQYGGEHGNPFFLFHRPRSWNAGERKWIGYERKRGKLAELNALLTGGTGKGFESVVGNVKRLSTVKYVITLDTDTQLPHDCANGWLESWRIR